MFSFCLKPFFSSLKSLTERFSNFPLNFFSVFSIRHSTYPEKRVEKLQSYKKLEFFYLFRNLNGNSPKNLAVKLRNSCRNCFWVSRLRFPVKFFYWKLCIFVSFSYFDWFSFIFGWIFFDSVCKTALYVSEDLFEENLLVLDSFSILQPFPDLSKNVSVVWRKLCGSLVKSTLFPPAEQKEGDIVLKKCTNFYPFLGFRVDRSGPSVAIFNIFVKFDFFVSKETFWIKIYLSNTFLK